MEMDKTSSTIIRLQAETTEEFISSVNFVCLASQLRSVIKHLTYLAIERELKVQAIPGEPFHSIV